MKMLSDLFQRKGAAPPGGQAASERDPLQVKAEEFVSGKWKDLRGAYVVIHMRIWEAFLFYVNEQRISWDKQRKFWEPQTPADEFTPQPKINYYSSAIDAITSIFNSVPEIEAVPTQQDDEVAIAIATIVNELIDYVIKENALRSGYENDEDKGGLASQLMTLAGSVLTEVTADDEVIGHQPQMQSRQAWAYQCQMCDKYETGLEQPVTACPQCESAVEPIVRPVQEPVIGEDGEPAMQPVTKKKINVRIANPLWVFPRPGSHSMEESPWLITASRMPIETIENRFGLEKITPDNEYPDGYSVTLENALRFYFEGFASSSMQAKDAALLIRAYVRPGQLKDFPEGLYAIYCNQGLKHAEPWPFTDTQGEPEHPYSKANYLRNPMLFWGRAPAFDLVEIQREENDYESIVKLHALTGSCEPIVVDMNTMVTDITGRGDKIIKWKSIGPGSKEPHRMEHGDLWPGIVQKIADMKQAFQTISGAVSVFKGEQPGSVTTATGIQELRAQAEAMFSKPTQNWANLWKETVRKAVKLIQKHKTFPEIVEIIGPNHETEIQQFLQCNLDATIEFKSTAAGVPRTRDERRQEMLTLFDRGAIDVNDPNVREKLFELFGETGMMQTFNEDARRARLNMKLLKTGKGMPIYRPGIDDPNVHLGIALQTAKSLDFDKWDPPLQQALYGYIQRIQQELAAQAPPPEEPPRPTKKESKPPEGEPAA